MDEKTWIHDYLAPLVTHTPEALCLEDDVAILDPSETSCHLLVSTDAIAQESHYLSTTPPKALGWKVLAVNISDIVAKGGTPKWFTLTCCFPRFVDETFYRDFTRGLKEALHTFNTRLLGGDTLVGEQSWFSGTLIGSLEGNMLKRSGAKLGDGIFVSGTIGNAMGGLFVLQNPRKHGLSKQDANVLIQHYHKPFPILSLGRNLARSGLIHSACDLSDGVFVDAQNLATQSFFYARIDADLLPFSPVMSRLQNHCPEIRLTTFNGGDDYTMLMCASPSQEGNLQKIAQQEGTTITRIGSIVEKEKHAGFYDAKKRHMSLDSYGYDPFNF